MKTIILYATKHGAAAEIAQRIAKLMDEAVIHDLKQAPVPSTDDYDCVIVGTSIYAGSILKEAKSYLIDNIEALSIKKLGLFISGMSTENEEEVLKASLPNELLKSAAVANILGGIFDPEKAGFFSRLIMRIVTKQSGYVNTIKDEKIVQFVAGLQ